MTALVPLAMVGVPYTLCVGATVLAAAFKPEGMRGIGLANAGTVAVTDSNHGRRERTVPGQRSSRTRLLPGTGPLSRVPPAVVFLLVLGLFGAGVAVGGPAGAALLGVLVLLVLALLTVAWRTLTSGERVMRVLVLLVLLVITVIQVR